MWIRKLFDLLSSLASKVCNYCSLKDCFNKTRITALSFKILRKYFHAKASNRDFIGRRNKKFSAETEKWKEIFESDKSN